MKKCSEVTVGIAGMVFTLHGNLPLLEEFVCYSKEKSNGQILCVYEALFDGTEKLIIEHKEITVYIRNDGSWLYVSSVFLDGVQVSLSADCKTISVYTEKPEERLYEQILRNLLRTAFECIMIYNSRLSLHSACIDVGDEALAFTGISGMGKSTRASAWISANGAEFISGDRPALHISADGVVAYGVPWDGKEQIFRAVDRRLKAVLDVRRSDSDYLRKLTPEQAQSVLMKQIFIPMWDTNAAFMAIMSIKKLSKAVPVYRAFCGPDEKSARNIHRILFKNPEEILEAAKDMKIKENFVLRNVADEYIVMPTSDNIAKFEGAVALNEVSAFIFEKLQNPISKDDLVIALLNEYDVDAQTAAEDVDALISKFEAMGIIE